MNLVATFTDLIIRVVLAYAFSHTSLGATAIWYAWPIGWTVGTVLSLAFCLRAIGKAKNAACAPAEEAAAPLASERAWRRKPDRRSPGRGPPRKETYR